MSRTTNNTALGRPPGSPRSQPSGRLTTLPPSPSATLSAIAAAADVDISPNPKSKKKRKKQKPQSGESTPAPAKSAPRSRNTIYYKPNSRGVLDWAREDEYFQGEIPSAEEMELFDEKFTTEANQGFTNPQLSKKAKEDRRKFLASVASNGFAQSEFNVPVVKGDVSNLRRCFFEDILLLSNKPIVLAWKTSLDTPLKPSGKRSRVSGKVVTMCCVQQNSPGYGGTTRSFNYDSSQYYIVTGWLRQTQELKLIKEGKMPLKLLKSKFNDGTGKFIFQIDLMPVDKRSSRLEIKWKDCVERPLDFLIFGPPSVDVLLFRVLFKDRNDLTTVFRIFRQVALEVWGDKELSQALIAEYRRKQVAVVKAEKVKLDSKLSDPLTLAKDCTFVGTDKVFFDPLDDLFRTCVTGAFVSMQRRC